MNSYVAEKPVVYGELEKSLAENGAKGWELVTVVGHVGGLYMAVWRVPQVKKQQMGGVGGR